MPQLREQRRVRWALLLVVLVALTALAVVGCRRVEPKHLVSPKVTASRAVTVHIAPSPVSIDLPNDKSPIGTPASAALLLRRLSLELRRHRLATSFLVRREVPWPKESGLKLSDSEAFAYDRHARTLEFFFSWPTGSYGWIYANVGDEDVRAAAQQQLRAKEDIYLPCVQAVLKRGGGRLQEKSTP